MTQNAINKIEALIEENKFIKYGWPLAGAAGLGYLGYQAGGDTAEGLKNISDRNQNPVDSGLSFAKELFSDKSRITSPGKEFTNIFIPGKDGSFLKFGEAIGNSELGHTHSISDEDLKRVSDDTKLRGGVIGTGLGYWGGRLAAPRQKNRLN